ncbi:MULTISPECIES: amidohydrolase [Paracoccus]|uniref:Peptidase n=1 Tax=Paracoccus kondratievae TaxID=135740 RepID=A0AAD3P1U7_9RHOB|nr:MULTISPECIES: amidohydrolase [Paracoccus]GLK65721.1 peptidase [Paracoccus kondratievae]SMG18990.1 amidohydrolase [Paracoccus sp. J56]
MNILAGARAQHDYMIAIRRRLHANPELSLQEEKTSQLIATELEGIGIPYVRVGDYGLVATISGARAEPMVALRADMDALPIHEANSHLDYISTVPGVMHACGHDGHVAMLLAAARILWANRDALQGSVKLCFQQAEEVGMGTAEIKAELARFPIQSIFGIHLWSELETGKISVEAGPRMASGKKLSIRVKGRGTHGAYPNRGVDPIIAAAAIVMNCATITSREIDPLAPVSLSFGKIAGGESANIIPEEVMIEGTLRTTSPRIQAEMVQAVERMAITAAETFRATATVEWGLGCGIVENHPTFSRIAEQAVRNLGLSSSMTKFNTLMASENFADYLDSYPGVFAFIGIRDPSLGSDFPHHHPNFNIDENSLVLGAALHAQYAIECLSGGKGLINE